MCGLPSNTSGSEADGGSVTRDGRLVCTMISEKRLKCQAAAHTYWKIHFKVRLCLSSTRQNRVGNGGGAAIVHFVCSRFQMTSLWYRRCFSTLLCRRRCIDIRVLRMCALDSGRYLSIAIFFLGFCSMAEWLFGLCRLVVGGKPSPLPFLSGLLLANLFVCTQIRSTASDAHLT